MSRLRMCQHVHAPLAETFERFVDVEQYPGSIRPAHSLQSDEDTSRALWFNYSVAGFERQFAILVRVDRDSSIVTWRSVDGPEHTGRASFHEVNPHACTLTLDVELHSSHFIDAVGAVLGVVRHRIEHDLHRFAAHVEEERGTRPPRNAPDHRAPSEKLFDAIFPTDERRYHP